MRNFRAALTMSALLFVTACGGGSAGSSDQNGAKFLAVTMSGSDIIFSGPRNNYTITKTDAGYSIHDNVGSDGTTSAPSTKILKFTDFSVNLGIGNKTQTISEANLQSIIELYIAYFNRVPGGNGLSYWIDRFNAGQSLEQIGTSFYSVAIQFSSLTGYASDMTDEAFVRLIYKNVLGRNTPAQSGVDYWASNLAGGTQTRGSLVQTMLTAAHTYKGDPTFGWVADLLDNKITVGKWFAVTQGLNYLDSEAAITNGMAIAAAVTSSDTAGAFHVVNMTDSGFTTMPISSAWHPHVQFSLSLVSSPPTTSDASPTLIFSPSIVSANELSGNALSIPVQPSSTSSLPCDVYIKFYQSTPVFNLVYLSSDSCATYWNIPFEFNISPQLADGHYTGNLIVSVCKDADCAFPIQGSPFALPYDIDLASREGKVENFNAPPISPLTGAVDWETFQGNAAHTGYVPVTLNPAAFTARWKWIPPTTTDQRLRITSVVTAGGRFFAALGSSVSDTKDSGTLIARNESDASAVWSFNFVDPNANAGGFYRHAINSPAVSNGKVYMASGYATEASLSGFSADSGTLLFQSSIETQDGSYINYGAPVVKDGVVYTEGGYYSSSVYAFDATSGERKFDPVSTYGGSPHWSPAVDDNYIYIFPGSALGVIDKTTGELVKTISPSLLGQSNDFVLGSSGYVIVFGQSLAKLNTVSGAVEWQFSGLYQGNPAYAAGKIYALNNSTTKMLEVRNESDGTLAWSWSPPKSDEQFVSDVLLTQNLVFLSTNYATYAIDRNTHAAVWSNPAKGHLAMSANGVLYIQDTYSVVAVNLK